MKTRLDGSVLTWREEAVTQGEAELLLRHRVTHWCSRDRDLLKSRDHLGRRGSSALAGETAGQTDDTVHGLPVSDSVRGDAVYHATGKPVSCGMHGGSGVGST